MHQNAKIYVAGHRGMVGLTGKHVVHRIITDLCVMDVTDHGLVLREIAEGVTEDDIRAATGPAFTIDLQPAGAVAAV